MPKDSEAFSQADPPDGVALRPMHRSDLRAIVRLEQELFGRGAWSYDLIDAEMHSLGRHYVVATTQTTGPIGVDAIEKVVGYAGIAIGDSGEVMTVGVATAAQGRGIGRALMHKLIDLCQQRGVEEIFLEVRVDNAGAIALYRSLGFTDVRIRRGYYQPENIDALVMRRIERVP